MSVRILVIAPVAALALAAAVLPNAAGQAATSAVSFGTPVVVDNYRPGFEPDLAIDTSAGGHDLTYTSMPFGFSTTQSFIYRSDDHRQSFHLAEGNVAGKPDTCIGGGDTELRTDPVSGRLYFVDLQGLTNFSASTSGDHGATWSTGCNSVNGTGVDRQWLGIDSNGASSAVGSGPTDGRLYLDYDNVLQNTDGTNTLGNQLVMNESVDGVHYGSLCAAAGVPCPGPPAVISPDEGIPGNIVVDNVPGSSRQHTVYAIHTNSAGDGVIVSRCSGKPGDATAAQVAADCTDPTQVDPNDQAHVNVNWHDSQARVPGSYLTGNLFAAIAIDTAGNLYAVWSEYPTDADGTENGPGKIELAVSTDGAKTWSAPRTVSPGTLANNVMPWVAAGDPGRVDIAWYGAPQASFQGTYGPDSLDNGTWNVYMAQSLKALTTKPGFTVTKVSDHQAKFGNISTQGLGGSPDRSLGDFMQVQVGAQGQAVISYVDDTSADRNPDFCMGCGQTPPEAAGPTMIASQNGGPSLYTSATLSAIKNPVGSVSDSAGDASLPAAGVDVPGTPALDVTGASITQPDAKHLEVTMSTADAALATDLAVPETLGGPVAEWIVRWAAPTYQGVGDGNIFYVGMESAGGGAPEFYTGTTGAISTTHAKYFTYPKATAVPGKITGGTISWTVPLADVGSPSRGQGLFSVTGFTATQLSPSQPDYTTLPNGDSLGGENIPNTIDLSPPFSYTTR
jgi:hypothetical protein